MIDLDNLKELKALDKENVAGSIEQLGLQCEQAFAEAAKIKFPVEFKHAKNIIFSGMGGSALGAYIVKSLYNNSITLPFEIINEYHLPAYADEKTLAIVNSYSGTTEETVNFLKEALERKCMVTGATTGGKLASIFKNEKIPAYIYLPKYNPSAQPRMALGYPIFAVVAILNQLGMIKFDSSDINYIKSVTTQGNLKYGLNSKQSQNLAKKLAQKWYKKIPIIFAAEHLVNVGRVIRNQLNECAKTFSAYHDIPELNHHLMEGLAHPKTNPDILSVLFLESQNYSWQNKKRMKITTEIVEKNKIKTDTFSLTSKLPVVEAIECIQFGAYTIYYLALMNGVDPSKIPWVDYFKEQLAK